MPVFSELIEAIVSEMSPQMKTWVCARLTEWEAQAAATPSAWDDIMVKILKRLFNCPA